MELFKHCFSSIQRNKKVKSGGLNSLFGILAVFIIVFLLSGCGESKPDKKTSKTGKEIHVTRYFDNVLEPYTALTEKFNSMNYKLDTYREGRVATRGALEKKREELAELQALVSKIADKIADIPGYKGDTSLRDAVLDYVEYLEEYTQNQVPELLDQVEQYLDMGEDISREDRDYLVEMMDKMDQDADEEGRKFEDAQKKFAKRFGFKLQFSTKY